MAGSIQDVTESKEAERALKASEQRYRSLFVHNPHAVYSLDLVGRFLSVNPATAEISGYSANELVGTSSKDLIAPEDRERGWQHFVRATWGLPQSYEMGLIRKDGQQVTLSITQVPIVVDGFVAGVYGISEDITGRKQTEKKLERLASFPELNPNPIIEVNPAQKLSYVNPAARKLFPDLLERGIEHPMLSRIEEIAGDLEDGASATDEVEVGDRFYHRAAADGEPYDLAVLDAGISGSGARDLTRRIKTDSAVSGVRVVLLTPIGYRPAADAGRENTDASLTKPVRQHEFLKHLSRVIEGSGAAATAVTSDSPVSAGRAEQQDTEVPPEYSKARLLVVEDNAVNQRVVMRMLEKLDYAADMAIDGVQAVEAFERRSSTAILMDLSMARMNATRRQPRSAARKLATCPGSTS